MQLKLFCLVLFLLLATVAFGHSPVGGQGPHHQLKLRKRITYSDNAAYALNGQGPKSSKMPPRKMIEKPRLRFKGKGKAEIDGFRLIIANCAGGKLSPKHNFAHQ